MAKAELGMKLTCESCGARFYDLGKTPGTCPKCGAANARPVIFKASRRPAEDREKAPVVVKAPVAPVVSDDGDAPEPAADDDDEDEAVIEDTSDLGEDDEVAVPVPQNGET